MSKSVNIFSITLEEEDRLQVVYAPGARVPFRRALFESSLENADVRFGILMTAAELVAGAEDTDEAQKEFVRIVEQSREEWRRRRIENKPNHDNDGNDNPK